DLGDPVACIKKAKEDDPERRLLSNFLTAVAAIKKTGEWQVSDLIKLANCAERISVPFTEEDKANLVLSEVLHEITGEDKINPHKLGHWIERNKDNRCAGFYINRVGIKQRAVVWKVGKHDPAS